MDSSLPVLVVDDARFSRTIIQRSLSEAGFRDVRFAESGADALAALEKRTADIVIADWMMPEMDGLTLAERIRTMDEFLDHYTYILLLSGQEQETGLGEAFAHGIDDFVSKAALRTHLLPRIWAACRTAGYNNDLLARNRQLREQVGALERRNMIDPVTGLGNARFTDRTLSDILRQAASRGGAAGIVLVGLVNYAEIAANHEPAQTRRIVAGAAARLEQLVRPMDVVTRIPPDVLAVLVHQPDVNHCNAHCFRRLHEQLDGFSVTLDDGVQTLSVAMAVGAAHGPDGIPTADELLTFTHERLREAARSGSPTDGIWCSPP
jgi:diguanylate cyclase (GGDEF)-like protein